MSIKSSIVYAKVDKLEEVHSRELEESTKFQREVIERLARIEEALRMRR
jgi:translation elongation factor EF-Ts